jgi:hypothetical protein
MPSGFHAIRTSAKTGRFPNAPNDGSRQVTGNLSPFAVHFKACFRNRTSNRKSIVGSINWSGLVLGTTLLLDDLMITPLLTVTNCARYQQMAGEMLKSRLFRDIFLSYHRRDIA